MAVVFVATTSSITYISNGQTFSIYIIYLIFVTLETIILKIGINLKIAKPKSESSVIIIEVSLSILKK